jgi:hypothetical protein
MSFDFNSHTKRVTQTVLSMAKLVETSITGRPNGRSISDFWRQVTTRSHPMMPVPLANPLELIFVSPAKHQPD